VSLLQACSDADDEDPGSGRGKGKRIDKQQSKQIKASVSPEFADLRRRLGLPIQSPTPESDKAVPHSSDRDGESALLSQCPEAVSIGKQLLTHERALKSGAEVGDEEAEEPTAMEALLVAQRYFCLCTVDDLRLSDVNALLQDYRRLAESKAIPEVSSSKEGELTEPDGTIVSLDRRLVPSRTWFYVVVFGTCRPQCGGQQRP